MLAQRGTPQDASLPESPAPLARVAPFVFIACIVHYGGGPLGHEQLIFQNSVLRFDISTLPSDVGMVALRQLTVAQPLETVKLSL